MIRKILNSIAFIQFVEFDATIVIDVGSCGLGECKHLIIVEKFALADIIIQVYL